MTTDQNEFAIFVTPSMEDHLDKAKEEWYCHDSQNDMMCDLINRGLALSEWEKTVKENRR